MTSQWLQSSMYYGHGQVEATVEFVPGTAALGRLMELAGPVARVTWVMDPGSFGPHLDPRGEAILMAFESGEIEPTKAEVTFDSSRRVWMPSPRRKPHHPMNRWSKIRPGRPWELQ